MGVVLIKLAWSKSFYTYFACISITTPLTAHRKHLAALKHTPKYLAVAMISRKVTAVCQACG